MARLPVDEPLGYPQRNGGFPSIPTHYDWPLGRDRGHGARGIAAGNRLSFAARRARPWHASTTWLACLWLAGVHGSSMPDMWHDDLICPRRPRGVSGCSDDPARRHAALRGGRDDRGWQFVGGADRGSDAACVGGSTATEYRVDRGGGVAAWLGMDIAASWRFDDMKWVMAPLLGVLVAWSSGCSALLPAASAALGASQAGVVAAAGASRNFEYQKLKEVHARYDGLEHQSVAILVDATLELQYEHPDVIDMVSGGVAARIGEHVEGVKILHPLTVRDWQYRTAQWSSMPWGEVAERLQVDRIVLIDIQEFRLHPRGNRWLWDGVCRAVVSVAEADGYDPDEFIDVWEVEARFPELEGLDRDSANEEEIKTGLLAQFTKQTGWIFYMHLEPKYPDKYNPRLDPELDV